MLKIISARLKYVLYHGTSEPADKIRGEGLTSPPVWLTDNPELASRYAQTDQDRTGHPFVTIVELSVSSLDESKLLPDYQADYQGSEVGHVIETWQDSLKYTDQCIYNDIVPPHIIKVKDYT